MSRIHRDPPGLTSCPRDILYSIFELLSPTEFYALCLVHTNVRVVAAKFLYENIQMIWEQENHYDPPQSLNFCELWWPGLIWLLTSETFSSPAYQPNTPHS
ncbi:hypothetical protein N7444_008604 [Penicillium canescens]|nr:hypothetical protein N7444_008604 [Penicillium canescens]